MSPLHSFRQLIASGALLFAGMSVANVGAYLFTLITGRLLGPVEYGGFVALLSVALIITVPATAMATVAAKFSATFVAERRTGELAALVRIFERTALGAGLIALVATVALAEPIRSFLNLRELGPVLVLAGTFVVSFFPPISRGFLQGLQRFPALSVNTALEPLVKIVVVVLLIQLGLGLSGALISLAVSYAVVTLVARWSLRGMVTGSSDERVDTRAVWRYAWPTIGTLVALALLTTLDVVLVKHFFSPELAGIYAGLAAVGKIILYASTPLVAVMFPLIVARFSHGTRHFPLLAQTFMIVTVLSLSGLGVFTFFPDLSIRLLFGAAYLPAAVYLSHFASAIVLLSLATVLVHYFLSIGVTRVSWLLAATLVIETVLMVQFHASISQVVNVLIGSYGFLLVSLVALYTYLKRDKLQERFRELVPSIPFGRITPPA